MRIFWGLRRLQARQQSRAMGKARRAPAGSPCGRPAYREAGHAVVARLQGVRLRRATIVKQRRTSMAGFTTTR